MQTFLWDSHFLTGIDAVDEQHHALVDLINRFGEALLDGNLSNRDCVSIVTQLRHYTEYHFREEEALMQVKGLYDPALHAHERAHSAFVEEIARLERDLPGMDEDKARQLHDYLVYWLGYHILGIDQSMARQLAIIDQGSSPKHAYEAERSRDAGPTQPLVDAIVGLLHILEDKNAELSDINASLEAQVNSRTQELQNLSESMRQLAMQDQLTGLPNRRRALDFIDEHWPKAGPFSCLMIDLDHFKQVNDQQGHDAGDAVLRRVAREIQANVRTDDLVSRLGGDEFLVICPDTPEVDAAALGERVRRAVDELRIPAGDSHVTLSIGVASRPMGDTTPRDLLLKADQSLYAAKKVGRNAVYGDNSLVEV